MSKSFVISILTKIIVIVIFFHNWAALVSTDVNSTPTILLSRAERTMDPNLLSLPHWTKVFDSPVKQAYEGSKSAAGSQMFTSHVKILIFTPVGEVNKGEKIWLHFKQFCWHTKSNWLLINKIQKDNSPIIQPSRILRHTIPQGIN